MLNRHRTQKGLRTQLLVLLPKNHIKLTAGYYLESKIELVMQMLENTKMDSVCLG